jgi:hypothetical protein
MCRAGVATSEDDDEGTAERPGRAMDAVGTFRRPQSVGASRYG